MAELVVKTLEEVHVEEQQGQRCCRTYRTTPFHVDGLIEMAPIGDAGESILQRQLLDPFLGTA